jgi:predicted ribosomally synthesized peptide with SipW-like signal peptide
MMNRKKSILFSLAIIGVAATMITAATSALFTDQVVSEGNTLTAGTLLLSVDNNCGLTPDTGARTAGSGGTGGGTACQTTDFAWTPATTNMAIDDTASHEFTIVNDGSLDGTLTISQVIAPTDCFILTSTPPAPATLIAGGSTTFTVSIELDPPSGDDNDCQGDTATVTVTFDLVQT